METEKKPILLDALAVTGSLVLLAVIYVFQALDYWAILRSITGSVRPADPTITFVINKTIRLVLNDALCFWLIHTLFKETKYLRIAFLVFLFEFLLLLPLYFVVKLSLEGPTELSSPLLSPVHRLIVNPMLMLILIVAFYYQRYWLARRQSTR